MAKISVPLRTLKRFISACISDLIAIRTLPPNLKYLFGLFGSEGCEARVLSFIKKVFILNYFMVIKILSKFIL